MGIRYYICPENGQLLRLPITFGKNHYPQFANTRQKCIEVCFEGDCIQRTSNGHLTFDTNGKRDSKADVAAAIGNPMWLEGQKKQPVPRLDIISRLSREIAESRWQISDTDFQNIVDDITGNQRIPFA